MTLAPEAINDLRAVPASGPDHARGAVPLVEAIIRYRGLETGALHVPGHFGGAHAASSDLRTLVGADLLASDIWLATDDLARARHDAETRVALAWGADAAWILLNGSSGGNHAVHLAHQHPDRPRSHHVVVARDSHTSTLAGLILSGATPHWVPPRLDPAGYGVSLGVHPDDLDHALRRAVATGRAADLVSVVSPGYIGVSADVGALATVAHRYGAVLGVDEAWGAHLPFHPDLPAHAMSCGADIAVVSAHKMLPALSGAALVLARHGRADAIRLGRAVRMTQTTSPLLPVLASVDQARATMVTRGRTLLDRALNLAHETRRRLAAIPGVRVPDAADLGVPAARFDPLRLIIDIRGLGLPGLAIEKILREPQRPALGDPGRRPVGLEGADEEHLFAVIGMATEPAAVDAFINALAALSPGRGSTHADRRPDRHLLAELLAPREQVTTPREAYFSGIDIVPLARAAGRISAEALTPYPPGVPAVMPGERLDRDLIHALTWAARAGMHFHGAADPTLTAVGVLRT